jgi:hypothetical protein
MTNRQILTRIKNAQRASDIEALLSEGEMFENVSHKTRARWEKAAERRRKWLEEQA